MQLSCKGCACLDHEEGKRRRKKPLRLKMVLGGQTLRVLGGSLSLRNLHSGVTRIILVATIPLAECCSANFLHP